MIAKVRLHDNVAALLDYVVAYRDNAGRKRPEVVALGGPAGRAYDSIKEIFTALAETRRDLQQPLASVSLRIAPSDRLLSDREWRDVASRTAAAFRADVWSTWRHGDDHVHVLWSRIRLDRTVVDHRHDYRRCETVVRDLERAMGLKTVTSSSAVNPGRAGQATRRPDEDATVQVHYEAAWHAWRYSADELGGLVPLLGPCGVQLTLDEVGNFCVVLGEERIKPLVPILIRRARQEGLRPPRERDVLRRLHGITGSMLSPDLVAYDAPVPETVNSRKQAEQHDLWHGQSGASAGSTLHSGLQQPWAIKPDFVPNTADRLSEDTTADRQHRRVEAERKKLLARRKAELDRDQQIRTMTLALEADDRSEWARDSIEESFTGVAWIEEKMLHDSAWPESRGAGEGAGRPLSCTDPAPAPITNVPSFVVVAHMNLAAPSGLGERLQPGGIQADASGANLPPSVTIPSPRRPAKPSSKRPPQPAP